MVSSSAKLDYQMGYLVVRKDTTTKIHLGEIRTLLIESTAVSLTAALLSELVKKKVKVIFCDEKRNPSAEMMPYYGSHDCSLKIKRQTAWSDDIKGAVWTEIVFEKIRQQKCLLQELGKNEAILLQEYLGEIEYGDATNREGHAAKVYFNALFGKSFTRTDDLLINAALNYGYSILLSAFNREIVLNGYLTQLGLFHDNMFNQFNLASDLMEPFRPLVDRLVAHMTLVEFEHTQKMELVNLMNQEVMINERCEFISNAIKIYCQGKNLSSEEYEKYNIEKAIVYPLRDLENKRKEFIEDIELAQSYGQIDNTVENSKEAILQIMEVWYLWAIDTQNYGFFVKILEEFRKKIKNDAQVRAHDLQMSLDVYLKENGSWEEDELISKAVAQIRERIEQQNYAAAEDLLNRVITHDLDLDVTVQQEDYLEKFFDEYDINYRKTADSGATLKSLVNTTKANKDKDKTPGIFIMEVHDDSIARKSKKGIKNLIFNQKIGDYDKYAFCALASSETRCKEYLRPYLAEVVSSVCGDDVELCAACVLRGMEFLSLPDQTINDIIESCHRSDGERYFFNKSKEEITVSIWESQLKYIFPLIESYRKYFVKRYIRAIKNILPISNSYGEKVTIPEDVEIGTLFYLVGRGDIVISSTEYNELERYRNARNRLAHMNVLENEEVEAILKAGKHNISLS